MKILVQPLKGAQCDLECKYFKRSLNYENLYNKTIKLYIVSIKSLNLEFFAYKLLTQIYY